MKLWDNLIHFFVGERVKAPVPPRDKTLNSLIDLPFEAEILTGLANILSDGYITPEEEESLSILVECARGNPALYEKMREAISASHIPDKSIANLLDQKIIPCIHIDIPEAVKSKVRVSTCEIKKRMFRNFQTCNIQKAQPKVHI